MPTGTSPRPLPSTAAFHVALHSCRSQDELERRFLAELERLLPGKSAAICLASDDPTELVVRGLTGQVATASGELLEVSQRVPRGEASVALTERCPVAFGDHDLGELWIDGAPSGAERATLDEALAHFGTALANLALERELRTTTDEYCGTLQALEEGVVLFQETDQDALTARILSLLGGMVGAEAGGLYVFEEVGNAAAPLALQQAFGIPEEVLARLRGVDGAAWPDMFAGQAARVIGRDADGVIAALAPDDALAVLERVAVVPLHYHGVDAGVCVLFNPRVDVELGVYGRLQTFGQLAAALLHRLSLERVKERSVAIERELQLAATIQQRLVPSDPPPSEDFEFAWGSRAAARIGGDYVDFLTSPRGDIQAVIADVSGHGINSALLMTSFRANYRGAAAALDVDALAAALNDAIAHEVGPTGMFITAALVRLDPRRRRMSLCSAGHNPVMVYRSAAGAVEQIGSQGTPMGFLAGAGYERVERPLDPGDVVLLYTDGITEAARLDGEMFGEERLAALLGAHARRDAQAILAAALAELTEFTGREHQEDDVSLMVIRAR